MREMESPAPLSGGKPGYKIEHSEDSRITDCADPRLPPGTNFCLCSACKRYFGGLHGFERHRVNSQCLDPAVRGLELNKRGYWVRPAPKLAIVFGGSAAPDDLVAIP